MGSNQFFENKDSQIIREFTENKSSSHCQKCGPPFFSKAAKNAKTEIDERKSELARLVESIPIISIHHPYQWRYKAIQIVTGQSVTGTGVISELASSFTDLFGMQSGSFAKKLGQGELNCMNQLRIKSIELGGNAIIGTDIDYSEVGGLKGMLMVCMAGTAVMVENLDDLGFDQDILKKISTTKSRIEFIQKKLPNWGL